MGCFPLKAEKGLAFAGPLDYRGQDLNLRPPGYEPAVGLLALDVSDFSGLGSWEDPGCRDAMPFASQPLAEVSHECWIVGKDGD
jgi:hypothetical protein